jgi:Holliday junction DNA helicase RuvB
MNREPILTPSREPEDEPFDIALRPRTLDEYDVGQHDLVNALRTAITAARQRGEPLEHVLFDGPPGLGKTTLARIIANEMEGGFISASGPTLERAGDLVGILTNLGPGDIFFIDEIHRMPRVVEEFLYPAMEDFCVDFVVDKGPYAKTIKLPLKRFTIVGATTRAGLLTAPLRERFGIFHHLDFYTPEQLLKIIHRSARILDIHVEEGGAWVIAQRARGTARIANRLLRRVRDYAQVHGDGAVSEQVAVEALQALNVDECGLDKLDKRYLKTIIEYYHGGPVGVEAIAATLNEEKDTLTDVVEPYLLKEGFVIRSPRGRMAGDRAYSHLGYTRKRRDGQTELPV